MSDTIGTITETAFADRSERGYPELFFTVEANGKRGRFVAQGERLTKIYTDAGVFSPEGLIGRSCWVEDSYGTLWFKGMVTR